MACSAGVRQLSILGRRWSTAINSTSTSLLKLHCMYLSSSRGLRVVICWRTTTSRLLHAAPLGTSEFSKPITVCTVLYVYVYMYNWIGDVAFLRHVIRGARLLVFEKSIRVRVAVLSHSIRGESFV